MYRYLCSYIAVCIQQHESASRLSASGQGPGDMRDFTSAGVNLALPEEGQPMHSHTHAYYCTICEMFLPPTHVEDHLKGKKHRRNVTGDQRHIGVVSRPASSSEIAVQAGQGESVRAALLSLAGEEVGAINVAPDSGWREVAVEVRLQTRYF